MSLKRNSLPGTFTSTPPTLPSPLPSGGPPTQTSSPPLPPESSRNDLGFLEKRPPPPHAGAGPMEVGEKCENGDGDIRGEYTGVRAFRGKWQSKVNVRQCSESMV